ncbi:phasin family protein [Ramlibacter sp.]|uniref:phasin family protein n=1 Tax=Ramlibacter sp. TaxID=1917967 RepID=UPI002C3DA70B|nr:phasin family protein [Ramlibacter sp.]HWI84518.1 phasin family protein [Ramlibacter sp.]
MATEDRTTGEEARRDEQFADALKHSAQQIWLAGLATFARARQEGSKMFETLVKEGAALQRKTQGVAGERMAEATSRLSSMATDFSAKAAGLFDERVARTLERLGAPSAAEFESALERIDELERQVTALKSGMAPRRGRSDDSKPAVGPTGRDDGE